ncbi:multidrug effflux MFS transporter [Methylovorus menthalis]|uniref:multidrug effflux MFS transporter n=1 Tax=Methylovorus menthalis TaxID=1002227 RepID=UPI001E51022E|nr:multidrug effflux MFS transporter [Methylovorus menthalis]MCB4812379.1 multidrug effflux MFS transporter [Methylovorus menthalis]
MPILTIILAGLAMLGPFTTDTYFPFFPDIQTHFAISQAAAQQSLSVYLFSFTLMMLFHGAISDSVGRKPVIIISLVGFVITSCGCAMTDSYALLLAMRAGQGFFVGAGTVVGQAIIRDQFDGIEAQKLISKVTMLFGLSPAIAPMAGGWLQLYFPWPSAFVFLALLGVMLLVLCVSRLPETLPVGQRRSFHPASLLRNYFAIASDVRFMALSICIGTGFGGFLVYVAGAPDFVLHVMHLSEQQFGWLFIPIVIGLIAGSAMAGRLVSRLHGSTMIAIAYGLLAIASIGNLIYNLTSSPELPYAVIPILVYTLGLTMLLPGALTLALDIFPEKKGMAASVQGFVQSIIFTLISAFTIPLVLGSALHYAVAMSSMFGINLAAWCLYKFCGRRKGMPD